MAGPVNFDLTGPIAGYLRRTTGAGLEMNRTRTCCATPAVTPSPTRATTPERFHGWLGRRSITSTAAYTALAPNRFKDIGGTDRSLDCRAFPDVICHRGPRAGATTGRGFD
jgi:hypothetical protein